MKVIATQPKSKLHNILFYILCFLTLLLTLNFINKYIIKEYKTYFAEGKYSLPFDLLPYYNAGYILHSNHPEKLYDYNYQQESYLELHDKYSRGFPRPTTGYFYNPPNSLVFPWFWSMVTPQNAWILIKLTLLILAFVTVFTSFKEIILRNKWNYFCLFLIGLLYFPPFFINIRNGQFSLFVACCFYFYYYFANKQNSILSGLFLSLTLIKPQIGLPLLLIPICLKHYKNLFFCMIFTLLSTSIGLLMIGYDGFLNYLASCIQLTGIHNLHYYVPMPGGPECLSEQILALGGSPQIAKLTSITLSLFSLGAMLFILTRNTISESYRVFLAGLFSMFIGFYHTDNDYCLIPALVLIVISFDHEIRKKAVILFLVFSFWGGYVLDRLNIDFYGEIIKLRFHTHFKTYFLLSFFLGLFLLFRTIYDKNSRHKQLGTLAKDY